MYTGWWVGNQNVNPFTLVSRPWWIEHEGMPASRGDLHYFSPDECQGSKKVFGREAKTSLL